MMSSTVTKKDRAIGGLPGNPTQLDQLILRSWAVFISFLALSSLLGCKRGSSELPDGQSASSRPATPASVVPLTNMVLIKAGTFMRIKFPVTITRDFWIGKYEVTQGEFTAVLGRNPSHFTGDSNRPVEKVTFRWRFFPMLPQRHWICLSDSRIRT